MRLAREGLITYGALNIGLGEVDPAHGLTGASLVAALAALASDSGAEGSHLLYPKHLKCLRL
jgi:hypothetical protein